MSKAPSQLVLDLVWGRHLDLSPVNRGTRAVRLVVVRAIKIRCGDVMPNTLVELSRRLPRVTSLDIHGDEPTRLGQLTFMQLTHLGRLTQLTHLGLRDLRMGHTGYRALEHALPSLGNLASLSIRNATIGTDIVLALRSLSGLTHLDIGNRSFRHMSPSFPLALGALTTLVDLDMSGCVDFPPPSSRFGSNMLKALDRLKDSRLGLTEGGYILALGHLEFRQQ